VSEAEKTTPAAEYDRWQAALDARFFRAGNVGKPVVLFADKAVLDEMGGTEHLVASLCGMLDRRAGGAMFARITAKMAVWRRTAMTGPPPCLPLLAVTVLAATRMHRDEMAASHNYYSRLAETLDEVSPWPATQSLRKQLEDEFEVVAGMWEDLNEWLGTPAGATYGRSTIRRLPGRPRVGYPISQALLRRQDRLRLTAFLDAADVHAQGTTGPDQLVHYLKIWASRPRGLSQPLLDALCDPDLQPLLGDLLSSLADSWDGRVIEQDGRASGQLRLVLDLDQWRAGWALEAVPHIATDDLHLPDGGTVRVTRQAGLTFYELAGDLPAPAEALRTGVQARGRTLTASAPPRDLVPLRLHPALGCWVSYPTISPYEETVLVVHQRLKTEVESFLGRAARAGWRLVRQRPEDALLPGWLIYWHLWFTDAAALQDAARGLGNSVADVVRPDAGLRARLVNGLPLGEALGPAHYLPGGEPDLLLPSEAEPREAEVVLDGVPQRFPVTGFPIPLRRIGPLNAGTHEMSVDRQQLSFMLIEHLRAPQMHQRPHHDRQPGDQTPVTGRVHARRGWDTWTVAWNGETAGVAEPPRQRWLVERAPAVESEWFIPDLPSGTAWLVQNTGSRWRITAVGRPAPAIHRLSPASAALWRRLVALDTAPELHRPLWALYQDAARRVLGR
jgi:hypothetical protein